MNFEIPLGSWKTPTSVSDPGGQWTNDNSAADDDNTSYAYASDGATALQFNLPATQIISKIRILIPGGTNASVYAAINLTSDPANAEEFNRSFSGSQDTWWIITLAVPRETSFYSAYAHSTAWDQPEFPDCDRCARIYETDYWDESILA